MSETTDPYDSYNYYITTSGEGEVFAVDQTSPQFTYTYLPGCVNYSYALSHTEPCNLIGNVYRSSYTGVTLSGETKTFNFMVPGNVLAVRAKSISQLNTSSPEYILLTTPSGGPVIQDYRIWITHKLTETFEMAKQRAPGCTSQPGAQKINVGMKTSQNSSSCSIFPDAKYYVKIKLMKPASMAYRLTLPNNLLARRHSL